MTHRPFHHVFRLERAFKHLEVLEAEVNRWLQENPYELIHKFDPQVGKGIIKLKVLDPPSPLFGLIVGECLHNFRSALDNLTYELAVAYAGNPPPPGVAAGSQFPIFGDVDKKGQSGAGPRMFQSSRSKQIGGIDPLAQTHIEDLQPYKRGNNFASDPLWMLCRLSNFDKHRLPHLTFFLVAGSAHYYPTKILMPTSAIEWNRGTLEDGAEVGRHPWSAVFPEPEMNVNFEPIFSIGFGGGSPPVEGRGVFSVLGEIGEHITDRVLPRLIPYLI